jgi:methylmalonyl-CoA/ethylmalonyl-CoA epimerase
MTSFGLEKRRKMKYRIFITLILPGLFITGCASTNTTDKNDLKEVGIERNNAVPFNGKKIVQIGIVVSDVEKYAKSYAEFFGVEVPEIIISETEDKAKTQYLGRPTKARVRQAFFRFDNISLELLEPVGGPSTWKDFLDSNGEGVHHIAFEIKGMDERIAEMQGRGASLIQQGQWTTYTGGRYAYFDSNDQLAVILELLENF